MVVKEKTHLKAKGNKRKNLLSLLILMCIIVLVNFLGSYFFKRFDLTSEKRYTLAESTRALLSGIKDEVYLKIYLEGDFNPSFSRLKNETREILDEFRAYSNNNIQYEFIVPGEGLNTEEAQNIEKQQQERIEIKNFFLLLSQLSNEINSCLFYIKISNIWVFQREKKKHKIPP
jgi:ABC-type uncharacterized transport system involved in gliding motility auxiliary subunit